MFDGGTENSWLSWRDLIDLAPQLGIPHFQRGHVWSQVNVATLLESMIEGSPCGSMVLWRPSVQDPGESVDIGESLVTDQSSEAKWWLIDGQQRVRSLLGVVWDAADDVSPLSSSESHSELEALRSKWQVPPIFHNLTTDEDFASDEGHEGNGGWGNSGSGMTWFVSLPRMFPVGESGVEIWTKDDVKNAGRFLPFRYLKRDRPERQSKAGGRIPPPGPRGLLPMSFILSLSTEKNWAHFESSGSETDASKLERDFPWGPHCLTGYGDSHWRQVLSDPGLRQRWALLVSHLSSPKASSFRRLATGGWFAVGRLPDGCSYDDAVSAYVRINRAGVRVRVEERAYAELIRRAPQTTTELRYYSEEREERMWEGASGRGTGAGQDRRWLMHATERSFGFPLWMRAVVRDLTIAFVPESATKSEWQSAETIERWTMKDRLSKQKAEVRDRVQAAPKRATSLLLVLDNLLSEQLRMDNPMALPDARSFLPLIDLLARHDDLVYCSQERKRPRDIVLGNVLLWLMVHRHINQDNMGELLNAVASPGNSAAAIEALVRAIRGMYLPNESSSVPADSLQIVVRDIVRLVGLHFDEQRRQARTIKDRVVGFLYGIERRMCTPDGESIAREFAWSQLTRSSEKTREELALQARWKVEHVSRKDLKPEDVALERQHVVPFSIARQMIGKAPSNRNVASDVNSVSNLTWLTRRQNTFAGGLGADMVDLKLESQLRLEARGLHGEAKEAYGKIFTRWYNRNQEGWKDVREDADAFHEFCESRGNWISEQMNSWLAEATQDESWLKALAELKEA